MVKALSDKQKKILEFLKDEIRAKGYPLYVKYAMQ